MASAAAQTAQAPKPSFATVAAPAYVPPNNNRTSTSTSVRQSSETAALAMPDTDGSAKVITQNSVAENADMSREPPQDGNRLRILRNDHRHDRELPDQRSTPDASRQPTNEDSSTQVSSSNSSGKPASGDADEKSTTSGTTFALDEKESLRPDDSASLRCNNEEEEAFSAAGSVVAGSRVGSDSGARAFRDQLREISGIDSAAQRQSPPETFSQPPIANGTLVFAGPPLCAPEQQNPAIHHPVPTGLVPERTEVPPDEKLLEALESPRDRVFVLKLEQDTIDFLENTREDKLELPQCNAFYRMLAHKLADYYMLGHLVDPTGTAVVFHRTQYCRIPMLLSAWPTRAVAVTTPPPNLPARKIMRRGDDAKNTSGTNTTTNSEGPSKTTSEVGGDSGSDNDPKSKAALSREERQAKYNEVRQRIFGDAAESSIPGTPNETEDKDTSRSSSAAGKKKTKKSRNYNDDGFEPRSQISTYYTPQYPTPAIAPDNMFYNVYPGVMNAQQFPLMATNGSPQVQYSNGLSPVLQPGSQPQYQWPVQPFPIAASGFPIQGYGQPAQINYDQLTADFQRGMQSFQTANSSPAMPASAQLGFQNQFQSQPQPTGPFWASNACNLGIQYSQPGYVQPSNSDSNIMPSTQGMPPMQYPYGQLPNPVYNGSKQTLQNQHPVPGSYMGRQFNPQSQTFIPGGRMGPPPSQPRPHQTPSPSMSNSGFGSVPNPTQRGSPSTSHPNNLGSPRMHQTIASPAAANAQGLAHPLPQPPNPQSSIAKWGTPAHLPPKPPPPATMEPQKFHEINRTMPTHTFPYLPARLPNGSQGALNGNVGLSATPRATSAGGVVKPSS